MNLTHTKRWVILLYKSYVLLLYIYIYIYIIFCFILLLTLMVAEIGKIVDF
ncbi:MAG: hypothetical protein MCS20_02185 [Candidatus Phytoplasma mali]|nr:hypothetical protein [Candidatus Phytoplasma australiense]MCG7202198.1 hypothetical protein [Candidatus Phytoplasma mali]